MRILRPVPLIFRLGLGVTIGLGLGLIGAQTAPGALWIGLVPLLLALIAAFREPLRRWNAARRGFPEEWRSWLNRHAPYYRSLDEKHRRRFERDMQIFLHEQTLEGVAGVKVDQTLKLALASAAAALLNGRPDWELSTRHTFLFYPANFNEDYLFEDEYTDASIMGRAHRQGPVILSAPAVRRDVENPRDGRNLMLHELAHLLEFEQVTAQKLLPREEPLSRQEIMELIDREMDRIEEGSSLLGTYAGTHESEFFAVATERFFEQPRALQRQHPELYEVLRQVFNQTPKLRGNVS